MTSELAHYCIPYHPHTLLYHLFNCRTILEHFMMEEVAVALMYQHTGMEFGFPLLGAK